MLITADRALLAELIDYAGLFPPASLDLGAAVAEYRAARAGSHGWMLGRFICPASRLEDLAARLVTTMESGEEPWRISVIFDGESAPAAALAQAFDREMSPAAAVTLLEVPLPAEASDGTPLPDVVEQVRPLAQAALSVSVQATPFFEIARTEAWETGLSIATGAIDALRTAANRHMGAKLRCGGLEPSAFPTPEQVARFITACRLRDLPFKATAGLHHPVRHRDADLAVMRHGFLNLLVAAAFANEGVTEAVLVEIIEETDPEAFSIGASSVRWRDREIGVAGVRAVRSAQFAAYGSCSFDEPVGDLVALGLLDGAAS